MSPAISLRAAAICLLVFPAAGAAQCDSAGCPERTPRWVGEFAALSANAFLGGITAGLSRHFAGGSFRDGFVEGLAGGGVVWAGKRVAAERFAGAGLAGRQVAAVGISMVTSAGASAPLFSHVELPLAFLRLDIETATKGVRARLDPVALGWMVYAFAEPELHFDAGASISGGTPVFRTRDRLLRFGDDSVHAAGVTNAGIVFVADVPAYGEAFADRARAHERVHVLQQDQIAVWWTLPLTRAVLGRVPFVARAAPYLDVNLSTELMRGLGGLFTSHADRPWEIEATFLARD